MIRGVCFDFPLHCSGVGAWRDAHLELTVDVTLHERTRTFAMEDVLFSWERIEINCFSALSP
jgi:hypothetical protein